MSDTPPVKITVKTLEVHKFVSSRCESCGFNSALMSVKGEDDTLYMIEHDCSIANVFRQGTAKQP